MTTRKPMLPEGAYRVEVRGLKEHVMKRGPDGTPIQIAVECELRVIETHSANRTEVRPGDTFVCAYFFRWPSDMGSEYQHRECNRMATALGEGFTQPQSESYIEYLEESGLVALILDRLECGCPHIADVVVTERPTKKPGLTYRHSAWSRVLHTSRRRVAEVHPNALSLAISVPAPATPPLPVHDDGAGVL